MIILVLGASGMLGNAVFRLLSEDSSLNVFGTVRSAGSKKCFDIEYQSNIKANVDVLNHDNLVNVMGEIRPDVVINCVGLIKQLGDSTDPLVALPINSLFPHRLARLCKATGSRLVHVSTDCVFSGEKGAYTEQDVSDATDLYGKSKFIGEIHDQKHVVTLRTSIIGHELNTNYALIDWFLSQEGRIKGFSNAIFSGLPTPELARVIKEYVLPSPCLHGLYHVAAEPISKYELLSLVSSVYDKNIAIDKDESFVIDRSLNGTRFVDETGYAAPSWRNLIEFMKTFQIDR
ncbi:MAG: SDR family oxidoreductase [Bacteroidetes bacterium]|nr:MAG: SDR family oxidoreductase [Bacteroidota bacterium]